MCLACDEADLYYRYQLIQQIAKGEMPEGLGTDDLINMGLPLPGEIELDEQPDGTVIYRQKSPDEIEKLRKAAPAKTLASANAFACDSPDE
jgi:hypothetical protein